MSLLRRWFDPIRSRWFYQRPMRQEFLSTEQGLSIHLRLDDVYSYLAVQQLIQLNELLVDAIKPLKVIISDGPVQPPNGMSQAEWLAYCFNDAKILARQHRFDFDDVPELPQPEALKQAKIILENTPLRDENFLYLLENVFHMLWQQQYGKLKTLYTMIKQQPHAKDYPERIFNQAALSASFFEFGGRRYQAVDDLLRLTRRLNQQKLLTGTPIFLIDHIEWREHLINDAEELAVIQGMRPELDLFIALEDPISWLLLAYIREELANYYDIALTVYPLSYQKRDFFDWSLATRLSKRTQVAFTPFCRPTQEATFAMAKLYYAAPEEQRTDVMYDMLQAVWTQGFDPSFKPHFQRLAAQLGVKDATHEEVDIVLRANDQLCQSKHQPNFPVLELRVNGKQYLFNSLYRVWLIESIFSHVLEQKYKAEN